MNREVKGSHSTGVLKLRRSCDVTTQYIKVRLSCADRSREEEEEDGAV